MGCNFDMSKVTPEMTAFLKATAGATSFESARAAQLQLAVALTLPLQQGVPYGDNLGEIFEMIPMEPGVSAEFPLDFLSPGTEKDFTAYTIPYVGRIPNKHVEGDYVMVPTYRIGNSIDWDLKYARDARWDIIGRAMQVLEAGFVRKKNDDGWHVIIASAKGRNLQVYDDAATAGLFTKRLVALMETYMARNGGGNTSSTNRGVLTDLFISPEMHQDVLSWDLTQIPDAVRTQIWSDWAKGGISSIGRVRLHDLVEFGSGQSYELYYENTLGGSLSGGKGEIVIGLDLVNRDSFVMPQRQDVKLYEDMMQHRSFRAGLYGSWEGGFSALSSRRALLASA